MRPFVSPALTAAAAGLLCVAAACSRPAAERAANADSAAAAAATPTTPAATASSSTAASNAAAPTAAVVVLYNWPKDTAAFEKYYAETHLPLLAKHATEIGFTRGVLVKFDRTADGKRPAYYRKAELWFPSKEAMDRAMGTAGFKAVGADFANFNSNGGPTVMIAHETNNQ